MTFISSGRSEDSGFRRYTWQAILFSALFFAVAVGAIGYFLTVSADRENALARSNALHLAETMMHVTTRELTDQVLDYAWWDDTAEQATTGFDPEWADDNIGSYIQESFGYAGSYALGADGETVFASSADDRLPSNAAVFLGEGFETIIREVRDTSYEKSQPKAYFVVYGDTLYAIAAGAITVEEPTAEQLRPHPRPVLIFVRAMDAAFLERAAELFLLHGLKLAYGATSTGLLPVRGYDGRVLAHLDWNLARPGDTLISELLPRIALVSALLAAAAVAVSLIWSRSARAANVAKSRFLATMSHELRTPLNPIIGFADLMRLESLGPMPDVYRTYAEAIHRSGTHLHSIVNDVLDFSKIESGELKLNESVVDLGEIIRNLPPVSVASGGARGVLELRCEIDDDLPSVRADAVRIRQILFNLLSNAAKYSGGKEVVLRALRTSEGVRLEVEDQGPGIPAAQISKLFTPFVQGDPPARVNGSSGTGLGLPIARELAGMHGGTLELRSELGRGTVAVFLIPADRIVAP